MFVLRCAFWLTVGFILVAPHGTDFGAQANALKDQAVAAGMQAGEQLIVSQVVNNGQVAQTLLAGLQPSGPTVVLPMPVSPAVFPRPRPATLG